MLIYISWQSGFIVEEEKTITEVSTFAHTYEDIIANDGEFPGFAGLSFVSMLFTIHSQIDCLASFHTKMPHPLREKVSGHMVYRIPLIIFMDDVSGNISKQWNKHHVIYMSNASLPQEMLKKEFCIWFVTSSPHASPMELMMAMKNLIWYVYSIFFLLSHLSQWG